MKKKLLSLIMATAMILSLAVPVFATDWHAFEGASEAVTGTVSFPAKTFVPTIRVSMPKITSDPVVLNPYKIKFDASVTANKLNGQSVNAADDTKQIICPVYSVKNETNVKMNFTVSTNTTVNGIELVDDHVAITEGSKKAMIMFVYSKTSDTAITQNTVGAITDLDPYDTAKNAAIKLASGEKAGTVGGVLDAAAVSGSTITPNYLKVQFAGEIARSPSTAWSASDTLSTVVTFSFSPVSAADFTNTVAAQTVNANGASTPIGFTLPTRDTAGAVDKKDLSTALPANFTLSATAPTWDVVDGSALGATIDAGKLNLPVAGLNAIQRGAASSNYKVLLSFKDKDEVPRTLEVTVPVGRASS